MSSKTGVERRRPHSLAARLTLWYAGSAFVLVAGVTAFLYWALARSLDREDDEALADKVRVILALLDHADPLRQEIDEARQVFQHSPVFVRIVAPGGAGPETAGMTEILPPSLFPPATAQVGPGTEVWTAGGRRFRVLAVEDPRTGRVVQAGIDRTQDVELLAEYRRLAGIALAVALVASAAVGHRIARRGLRPLRAAADTAGRIGPTRLDGRLDTVGLPAELLVLADAFNAMLDRLAESFARLSRFSADIAHELRTPVNNLRGGIEVALAKPRTPDAYRDALGSGLEECGRLGRLIESLLFLARAENPGTQLETEWLDVAAELAALGDFYGASAADAGVTLTVTTAGPLPARLNRSAFQRAVGNLIGNALAHTPAGGAVDVSAAAAAGHRVEVVVRDTGVGIAPEHLPHVFDRFYRADPARPSAGGHLGLGLALVKGIADLHGGSVALVSEVGRGTRATIAFPTRAGRQDDENVISPSSSRQPPALR